MSLDPRDNFFAANQELSFVRRTFVRQLVKINNNDKLSKSEFITELDRCIADLEGMSFVEGFDERFTSKILKTYSEEFIACADIVLKSSFVSGQKTKLKKLAGLIFTRQRQLSSYSGIVFAGFGDRESLPRLVEYKCDLMIMDKPRAWKEKVWFVDGENSSEVIPLADSEVIQTLIQGISPGFENEAYNGVLRLLLELPRRLIEPITQLSDTEKQQYIADASRSLPRHFKSFYEGITKFRSDNYTVPIKQSIASLPVSELALVAESFLSASQILKKVNPDLETVGGPVDVAVISKGDGFIWIKRKHYFSEDLNPAFKLRYFDTD